MTIGVVADTHSLGIPKQLWDDFKNVDLIIHAGDVCTSEDLKQFSRLKDVKAVRGNMDDAALRKLLPEKLILEIEGCRIGVYHGEGAASQVIDSVRAKFKGKNLNAVIFGHSHMPMNEVLDHTLYFNPGSPNDQVVAPYRSYGILDVAQGQVSGRIIKVKD